jgi:Zn-dependent peptidase ImmA (M78 family)/DNA-binding XRE family transcriptional regulator
MANLAYVNPTIILWARELGRLTEEKLAKSVGVHENQIRSWQEGKTKPTFNQSVNLANALHIPYGYLFLSEPPKLELPLPDFRTVQTRFPELTPDFLEVVYGALDRHDWYKEYIQQYGAEPLPFVGSFTMKDDPVDVAASIRQTLSLDSELRLTSPSVSKYLTALSDKAEAAGILIMRSGVVGNNVRRGLDAEEFQGFAVADPVAPIVFVNAADYVSARVFTLAHELAHIWIGKSGISNPDEAEIVKPRVGTESFCNAVAAETLVPKSEFLARWTSFPNSVRDLAGDFRVSRLVILRRAYEFDSIDRDQFFSWLPQVKGVRKKRKGGRGDHLANIAARHSPRFMDSIIKDVRTGGTPFTDGARLLDMQVRTFARLVESGEY